MALTTKNAKAKPDLEISIDDGWHLDLVVAYYLEHYNLRATFYVVCDWIGQPGYLTWPQIKMLDQRGHKIGSHTMSHPHDLKQVYNTELHYEVQNSKDIIETVLGHKIDSFCYPRGRYDERVKDFVAIAGYTDARITGPVTALEMKNSLEKPGNWHIFQRAEYGKTQWEDWGDRLVRQGAKYINLWAHSKEIHEYNNWDKFNNVLANLNENSITKR